MDGGDHGTWKEKVKMNFELIKMPLKCTKYISHMFSYHGNSTRF